MRSHYYGTIPALAWIFGKFFYGQEYRTWIAEEFFSYRLPNPKSSNPLRIYQDLYEPWKDRDDFDKYIIQSRANIREGVVVNERLNRISRKDARIMKQLCDKVDIVFMYPVVLRVDIDELRQIGRTINQSGSGATVGSHEFLVEDLEDGDFEILFLDYDDDPDFHDIVYEHYYQSGSLAKGEVARRLIARC